MTEVSVTSESAVGRKVDRDEVFVEYTKSICPVCKVVVDAQVNIRDGKVYLRKRCREHGWFEALVYGDAQAPLSGGSGRPAKLRVEDRFISSSRSSCALVHARYPDIALDAGEVLPPPGAHATAGDAQENAAGHRAGQGADLVTGAIPSAGHQPPRRPCLFPCE